MFNHWSHNLISSPFLHSQLFRPCFRQTYFWVLPFWHAYSRLAEHAEHSKRLRKPCTLQASPYCFARHSHWVFLFIATPSFFYPTSATGEVSLHPAVESGFLRPVTLHTERAHFSARPRASFGWVTMKSYWKIDMSHRVTLSRKMSISAWDVELQQHLGQKVSENVRFESYQIML